MKCWLLALLLGSLIATPAAAPAVEVPPELRGRLSAEVTSCEPFRGGEGTRVVLVRVRSLASGVRQPEIRCGAFEPGGERALSWSRVEGLERLSAGEAREAMVLVPADDQHAECRCVVGDSAEPGLVCEPWQALEDGRCVEPDEVATPRAQGATGAPSDELSVALRVSRALAPLHPLLEPGRSAEGATDALCTTVAPSELAALVLALVPEDGTVYVRPLWRRLDAADQAAFAIYVSECFGVGRIVDALQGIEVGRAPAER